MDNFVILSIFGYVFSVFLVCYGYGACYNKTPDDIEEILAMGIFWPIHCFLWFYKAFMWSVKGGKGEL